MDHNNISMRPQITAVTESFAQAKIDFFAYAEKYNELIELIDELNGFGALVNTELKAVEQLASAVEKIAETNCDTCAKDTANAYWKEVTDLSDCMPGRVIMHPMHMPNSD